MQTFRSFAVVLLLAATSQAQELSVGFGETDVSPALDKKPVFMAGFSQNRKATKIHDPIMARAVVVSDGTKKIALVCADVVGLFNDFVERVRGRVKGFAYVCVSSTHNHEGPDTMGLWGPSPFKSGVDDDYMKFLEDRIVGAIEEADKGRQSATAKIGVLAVPELLHDARQPKVLHDDLVVLRFENKERKPIGVLVQWNCHPETMDSKNTEITADYVATTVNTLKKSQGCPVAYFTGTVGGLMTSLHVPLKNAKGDELKDGTWEKTELFGQRLAEVAEKALAQAKPITLTPLEVRTRKVFVPVANQLYKLGWRVGVLKRDFYEWHNNPYPPRPVKTDDLTKTGAVQTEIGYLKLGELETALIPGEIYPELVLGKVQDPVDPGADFPDAPIEPAIFTHMKGKYKMLIGLANDEIGYIIPKRQWDAKAPYCYKLKKDQYGEENSVGPEAAPILCQAFADLFKKK